MKYRVHFSISIDVIHIFNRDKMDYDISYNINSRIAIRVHGSTQISKECYDRLMKTFDQLLTDPKKSDIAGGYVVTYELKVGDMFNYIDITDPTVHNIMSLLYDNGFYPMVIRSVLSQEWRFYPYDNTHNNRYIMANPSGLNYSLIYEIEYEESDLESCKYLQMYLSVSMPKSKLFKENYTKDDSLIVPGKLANGKNTFIGSMEEFSTGIAVISQKLVDILHDAKLTRHLKLQEVSYTTDKYKERMYRLAGDTNLPLPCPFNRNFQKRVRESKEELEKRYKYGTVWPKQEEIDQPWCSYLESQISSLEPFDFAFSEYGEYNDYYLSLVVSQAVYQFFKREGLADYIHWVPVYVFPDDNPPPRGGFEPGFAKLIAPFLPPDVRCLYEI